ncbi:winged helix-turn-helix domain-containing protein [Pseudoalteromonas sp. MTN2-4]|uniref:winged helix-turn-helix domain-containing protein n=1 Tax=Pseudoalteromonas sp. MTN2-4 TaxID=3056555 RepID=UPI0036F2C25B
MDSSYKNLPEKISINEFRVDFGTGQISTDTKIEVIEPKVMDLLRVLCGAPKQVHSAEVLFEKVWPRSIYSPNSVRRNIALLRQALSDEDKTLIKTHPKRGYSLEASIKLIDSANEKTQQQDSSLEAEKPVLLQKKSLHLALIFLIVCIVAVSSVGLFKPQKSNIQLLNLSPITSSNDKERYMQVSPNGRYMAYIQSGSSKRRLLLKNLVTQKEWPLSQKAKAYTYLAWDVHLNSIVYSSKEQNSISFSRILLDAQRKPVSEQILFQRQDITWNSVFFIDDKQNLYYLANKNSSEHSRNVSLYKHNLNTGLSEVLLEPNDDYKPYKISLSQSQSRLAILGFNKAGISEVKSLELNSMRITTIAEVDHNWHFLSWFENENALLLSNGSQLKQLNLSGDITTLDYKSYNFLVYPQIVKSKLYFIEAKSDQDILKTDLHTLAEPVKVVDSNTVDMKPSLSPDSSSIAYISLKNGLPQIFIRDTSTGQERLVFQNKENEYALTQAFWDKQGNRLVSSINNKPFIIHLEETHHSLQWLDKIIGVPKAWYQYSEAILFVDKGTHNDNLNRFDLIAEVSQNLHVELANKQVFLDNNDNLLSFEGSEIFNHSNNTSLLSYQDSIKRLYPQKDGFYYLKSQNQSSQLAYYRFQQPNKANEILNRDIQIFCAEFCNQISEIKGNTILLEVSKSSADILRLDLKKRN